ncbi:MAG: DUF2949 domain-containing protein [Xenococcaceae cyanobacterium MO_207.B15]|nr:DUF2949 domain-containing protein [Xenococcaceae cyanobacterium MO_207.B15]MDJ0742388.1 DUF2949 domain-containing protein [Xenococcaceae cyanobacterium MO_167.B27]
MLEKLINYLRSELGISADAISLARKTQTLEPYTLPIILWQYGLLDKKQLEHIFDWLEVS